MNYIRKYSILSCIINNDKVYPNIKADTASRGRFLDYSLKLLIKQTVRGLIKENRIDPNLPIKLVIFEISPLSCVFTSLLTFIKKI